MKMFMDKDKEMADKEIDCYGDLLKMALDDKINANFYEAAKHHENIARTLYSLNEMKSRKETNDQAQFILKQIEGDRQQIELIERLKADAQLDY